MLVVSESNKPAFIDISNRLWTPGSSIPIVEEKAIEAADYKKDPLRPKVDPNLQFQVLISSLQLLSSVVHDANNILTKSEDDDVITACELAQTRSFEAFVSLGRMVTSVRQTTPENDEIAVKMGDIWDRTDYSHIHAEQIPELTTEFRKHLEIAYQDIERIEDSWKDERSRTNQELNEIQVQSWVKNQAEPLTKTVRQLSVAINQHRESIEAKQDRPKYNSLGEALKAQDSEEFLKYFKKANYDKTNLETKDVLDALMRAAVQFKVDTVISAISEQGGDVNQTSTNGQTLFMQAIAQGSPATARALRAAGALTHERDFSGSTEVMIAAKNGQTESLAYLVEELGMDANNEDVGINRACLKGFTALIYAASIENLEAVSYLLKAGADPTMEVWSAADENGAPTAIDYTDNPEIEQILTQATQQWTNTAKKPKP